MTFKFDGWPRKTIGHPFCTTSSFVNHFKAIGEFKLQLQSRNAQFGLKIGDFLSCVNLKFDRWPWQTIGHFFYATSSFVNHFKAIGEFKREWQSGNTQFRSKSAIFVPCDLEISWMTLKNNIFFRPKYRLIWCLFFTKVYNQPRLKREIMHISKFQNKILYQSKKKIPDTFSTWSKCLQDPKWKSRLCSIIFRISYQTLAQCMCQSSTLIHYMYNLHNILNKISYNSISSACVEENKNIFNKIF